MILVVNDDGINAPGIRAAVEAVKCIDKVVVVAPAVQQSGVGRSISLFSPVSISKGKVAGVDAYSISGTPVDAVIAGIYGILGEAPDLLISGINVGENMSSEATTSGTVGAALEGASQGIPSIAISIHSTEAIKFVSMEYDIDFSAAKKVVKKLAKHVLKNGLSEGVDLLNVNIPAKVEKMEVEITRLARRMYTTSVEERRDPRGRKYYWIAGEPINDAEVGTDVHTVRVDKRISITPLKLDFTSTDVDLSALKRL
ncbi:MAG: 5'/3'-nucleotidase SurE [Candidatus Hydrothermarchaeaceae archaeon]